MSVSAVGFLGAAALYAGFQATIRLVVYPQLSAVQPADFVAYELAHQRRVSLAVGPLFALLVLATAAIVVLPTSGTPVWARVAAAVLLLVVLGVTWLLAVPEHRRLSDGFDADAHRRLLRADSIRLVAAVLDLGLAGWLVLR